MFLLAPLLIGLIIYYTAADMLAYRKRKRRVASGCPEARRRLEEIRDQSVRWATPERGVCRWCEMPVTPEFAGHTEFCPAKRAMVALAVFQS